MQCISTLHQVSKLEPQHDGGELITVSQILHIKLISTLKSVGFLTIFMTELNLTPHG